jgi:chemotaxis protein methyltransferase CheR
MNYVELTDDEYQRFCNLIYRVAGIRIAENKRVMVSNRIRRRLRATGIKTFSEYYGFLISTNGNGELPRFLDAITTNETYFFRDPQHYDWLGEVFVPEIIRQATTRKRLNSVRIWSAACSTGEEPYSIALKLLSRKFLFTGWRITLLGTDLSGTALDAARAGTYDARAIRLVEPAQQKAFFDPDQTTDRWIIKPEVKALISWKQHNLLSPLEEKPFDCIFLKNVLIYFDAASKQIVVRNVIDLLTIGGYLVIGPTEGISAFLGPLARLKPWLFQRLV